MGEYRGATRLLKGLERETLEDGYPGRWHNDLADETKTWPVKREPLPDAEGKVNSAVMHL